MTGKIPRNPYPSNLAKLIPTKVDSEEVKRRGWRDEGILVVNENDNRLGWPEKEFINQIGTKLYGKRRTHHEI
ncbi:MAG: uncharacterized protein K0R98_731 [Rickettsiaceae bacterium]|nr:uncharacterized protein [Rickettsiaceae bacterium]